MVKFRTFSRMTVQSPAKLWQYRRFPNVGPLAIFFCSKLSLIPQSSVWGVLEQHLRAIGSAEILQNNDGPTFSHLFVWLGVLYGEHIMIQLLMVFSCHQAGLASFWITIILNSWWTNFDFLSITVLRIFTLRLFFYSLGCSILSCKVENWS